MRTVFYKRLLLLTAFVAVATFANAQSDSLVRDRQFNNSVILSVTYYYFPKIFTSWRPQFIFPDMNFGNQYSIYYERKVYKKWCIGTGYTTWNTFLSLSPVFTAYSVQVGGKPNDFRKGALDHRSLYKMYDIYAAYSLNKSKKHKIKIELGTSVTWGLNTYIDTFWVDPTNYEGHFRFHEEKAQYFGIISSLFYDYPILKNRMSIGANLKYHKYFGLYSSQFDYGFHVGYNFL